MTDSGCWRDLVVAFSRAHSPSAAARTARRFLFYRFGSLWLVAADCRRKHVESYGLTIAIHRTLVCFRDLAVRSILAIVATRAIAPIEAFAISPISPITSIVPIGTLLDGAFLAGLGHFLVTFGLILDIILADAALVLILEACAVLAQHTEIMVRKLQIIFGLNAVARELRIAGHALVFLKQLRGIATLAVVLPVPRLTTEILAPLSSTATPAAALSIVDQILKSLRLVANPFASDGQGRAHKSAL